MLLKTNKTACGITAYHPGDTASAIGAAVPEEWICVSCYVSEVVNKIAPRSGRKIPRYAFIQNGYGADSVVKRVDFSNPLRYRYRVGRVRVWKLHVLQLFRHHSASGGLA